jgi:hypothetical protein
MSRATAQAGMADRSRAPSSILRLLRLRAG